MRDIVGRSCKMAGYPMPEDVVLTKHGLLTGVPSVEKFVWGKPDKPEHRIFTHIKIRFKESLLGPLLIGAGRFQGFGLLKPIGGQDAHPQ